MALVTVQRSPTPSTTSSPCASVSLSPRRLCSLLSLRLRFASTGPAERHCARAAPLPRPWHSAAANPPHPPHLTDELQERRNVDFGPHHSGHRALTVLARTPLWHAFLWLEHFLLGMSHSGSSPSPFLFPLLLCCRERTMGLRRCPLHPSTSAYPHPSHGPLGEPCTPFFGLAL